MNTNKSEVAIWIRNGVAKIKNFVYTLFLLKFNHTASYTTLELRRYYCVGETGLN